MFIKTFKRSYIIKQLCNDINTNVIGNNSIVPKLNGTINNLTRLKKFTFIDIVDGTTNYPIKAILNNSSNIPDSNSINQELKVGQAIELTNWMISLTPNRQQKFELKQNEDDNARTSKIHIIGDIPQDEKYLLQKKQQIKPSTLRSNNLIKYKNNHLANLMRFRSNLQLQIFNLLNSTEFNFIKVDPPILTTNDTEGNNETFKFYSKNINKGNPLNLTVSTQLHLEILAQSLTNVYALSPCFRAEKSDTGRHLSEFWMLELESTQFNDIQSLTKLTQSLIIKIVDSLLRDSNELLLFDNNTNKNNNNGTTRTISNEEIIKRWESIVSPDNWHHVEYIDIIKELNNNKSSFKREPPNNENINQFAITSEHEKWVSQNLFNSGFVFIKNYPKLLKPFYMKTNTQSSNNQVETVACFDLIFPNIGEIVGGSIREDNLINLRKNNLSSDLEWYSDLRKFGYRPSGGFGLGLERLISYLMDVPNIKDTIPFYRSAKSEITL